MREITPPEVAEAVSRLSLSAVDARDGASPANSFSGRFLCFDGGADPQTWAANWEFCFDGGADEA